MRRILTSAILDGYARRKDKSISLRFVTGEKGSHEVMTIDELTDTYGWLYFRPGEESLNPDEVEELDALEADLYDQPKSQSQRLRNVMYVRWQQLGSPGDFKSYYKTETEKIINHYKSKLDE